MEISTRIQLAEQDLDNHEGIVADVRKEIRDLGANVEKKMDSLRTVLIGILISVATASILLAVNVAAGV